MSDGMLFLDGELFKQAAANLKSQRLRSILTLLGIVIGIAAIIALIALGEGLNASVQQQFQQMGTDTLTILPGGGFAESIFAELERDDEDTIERIRGVESAVGIYVDNVRIEFKDEIKSVIVYGADASKTKNLKSMGMINVGQGRDLVQQDQGAILIGPRLADGFFENEIHLKENIKVNDEKLRVVGIMETAQHFFGAIFNNAIVTTLEDLERLAGEELTPFRVMVKVAPGQDIDEVRERIEDVLERKHGKKDFQITSPEQAASVAGDVLGIIQLVLVGIAAISLLVGGIGIMNTMLMSVTERTHEIGVLKAVGATNNRILAIFLTEAALIGLLGGVIGIAIGVGLSSIISIIAVASGFPLEAVVSPTLLVGALAFSMFVGLVSGFLPARRASMLDPVEAMRHA